MKACVTQAGKKSARISAVRSVAVVARPSNSYAKVIVRG